MMILIDYGLEITYFYRPKVPFVDKLFSTIKLQRNYL